MYEKIVQIALLFDFYGQLLTDKQIEIVDMYYNHDLSLSEISEQLGISRQGVYDTLKRAEKTLFDYEEKLKLVNRFLKQKNGISQAVLMMDEILRTEKLSESARDKLERIRKHVDGLLESSV